MTALRSGLRVAVVCGMTDRKLRQKIAPLQALPEVSELLLIRGAPLTGPKIVNYAVPGPLRGNVLTRELWRLASVCQVGCRRRPDVAVGMTLIGHCLHVHLLKRLFGTPSVFHIMGKQDLALQDERRARRQRWRWRFSLRGDVIVTRGAWSRRLYLERGGRDERSVFIQHNVFDFAGYQPDPAADRLYDMIYVGYLEPYKSVHLLLEAAARVKCKRGRISLAIAGKGSERAALQRRAATLGLAEDIHWLGYLEERELVRALQRSRLFVMTSLGEGLPQALIEALACGLPPVLFDDADVRDLVHPGRNGVLVRPGDTTALAAEIADLLENAPRREALAAAAAAVSGESRFTLAAQTENWRRILARALERNRDGLREAEEKGGHHGG